MSADRLDVAFLWHMHQPDYRDRLRDEFAMPWTYLHALKDYTDMADHLERHPSIRAVVNFVPVLLEQIDDYVAQIETRELRDPLLRLLAHANPEKLTDEEREFAVTACFKANVEHMLEPFPSYRVLRDLHTEVAALHAPGAYLSGAFFADLVTWYHLAWTGESVRRRQPWITRLMQQGRSFTLATRLQVIDLVAAELGALTARYRALQDRGQIELTATPYAHPLGPLLLDFTAARDALPTLDLPAHPAYPAGDVRFARHVALARADHEARFGRPPAGWWPAEGAISAPVLAQLGAQACVWAASGEAVLANTLRQAGREYDRARDLYHPWRDASGVSVVFRDDRLSDLIGFEYARWHGRDAARHFLTELEAIRTHAENGTTPLVLIALDGENAWEFYPFNGYYFFEELYAALAQHPAIRATTIGESLASPAHRERTAALPRLCAGSWVYGTLSTWIGDRDKNRAWDLLCEAKEAYDRVAPTLSAARQAEAERILRACEGSDWFWWFGDYNPAVTVASFELLYRQNLRALYQCLDVAPPRALDTPLSAGGGAAEHGGTMRRSRSDP